MRLTYNAPDMLLFPTATAQTPDRVIIHRQGNPGALAANALRWMLTQGLSIHEYIQDDTSFHAQHWDQFAKHCIEYRKAEALGFDVTTPWGEKRGDWRAVGVETCDISGGGPGQAYSLSQDTRITLVLRVADICRIAGIPVNRIYEHADFDPWQRADDLGNALNVPDFRLDVADVLAGREPYRTVQQYAYGTPTTMTRPVVAPPPILAYTQADLDLAVAAARTQGLAEMKAKALGAINAL